MISMDMVNYIELARGPGGIFVVFNQQHQGPHLVLSRRAIHQLGCHTEIFSWFVRSTADKREMQK